MEYYNGFVFYLDENNSKWKEYYNNLGDKICALSTAVHNQTIFWKVKNGGYKDEELK